MTSRALKMAKNPFLSCHNLQILLGHLTSVLPAVPLICLHSRFLQLDLSVVLDYFTFLDERGLAYWTITLHRSVLSATLPPLDGHDIGAHPLISHLFCGVFQQRPPTRHMFHSWDVASVFAVFASLPLPLDFIALQRKVAFLLAMASS